MAETEGSAIVGSNIVTQDEVLQLDFIIEMILLRLPAYIMDVLPDGIDIHKLKTREDDDVIVRIATNDSAVNNGVEELKMACGLKKPAVVVVTGSVHTEEKWMIQLTTRNYTLIVDWSDGGVAPESLAKFLANPEICFVTNTSGSLFKVFPFPMFDNRCRGSTTLEHLINVVWEKNRSVPRVAYEEYGAGRYAEGNLFERKDLVGIMSEEANKERICRRYIYYKICYSLLCYLFHGEPLSQD